MPARELPGQSRAESKQMKRILIVKPSSLGDILHAFPAASLLCERIPGLKVDWLVHPSFAQLLDYMPCVERAIPFKRGELGKASSFVPAMLELSKEIRREPYDAVIDLQGLIRSASIAFLARSKRRVGHASPKEPMAKLHYTERIDVPKSITHAADRNTALVSAFLGIPFESRDFILPSNAKNMEGAAKALEKASGSVPKPLTAIIPGARWDTKRWPPAFFAKLACAMAAARPELSFAILGAPSDMPLAREIIKETGSGANVFDMTGRTSIGELAETLRLCSVAISNDSGPMHVAAAVGTPLVALFGPTEPSLTGPRSNGKAAVLSPNIDCIGCMRRYCQKGLCHLSLDPENAASAALDLLRWRN